MDGLIVWIKKNQLLAGAIALVIVSAGYSQFLAGPNTDTLTGAVTKVRDGDTILVGGIAIRLAALDCPEKGTQSGDYATGLAKQFLGFQATCELTGAKTYDRLVGYCTINGADFGRYMIDNSSCAVWKKYDVWNRYQD